MEKVSMKLRGKTLKKILKITGIILVVLLVVVLAVYFTAKAFLRPVNRIDQNNEYGANDPAVAFQENEPIERNPVSEEAEQMFAGKDVINILLVGQDRRAGEEDGPKRTDAMILCTINRKTKTVILTSFLGDLWVYIPDLYNQRLNTPYMLGGFSLLNDTLDYNFGIRADYNVEMDFSGFMNAIDILGGVEVQLTAAEAQYLNQRGNWGVEVNQNWDLSEGVHNLSGSQALAYTRIRQLGTDFARTGRQQAVIQALVKKMGEIGSADLFDYLREILPLISTDMTDNQILGLLVQFWPIIPELEIKTQHIPISGQYSFDKKGDADVLVMNKEQLEKNKKLLRETIGS